MPSHNILISIAVLVRAWWHTVCSFLSVATAKIDLLPVPSISMVHCLHISRHLPVLSLNMSCSCCIVPPTLWEFRYHSHVCLCCPDVTVHTYIYPSPLVCCPFCILPHLCHPYCISPSSHPSLSVYDLHFVSLFLSIVVPRSIYMSSLSVCVVVSIRSSLCSLPAISLSSLLCHVNHIWAACLHLGGLAHMVERVLRKHEAKGSIPLSSIIFWMIRKKERREKKGTI